MLKSDHNYSKYVVTYYWDKGLTYAYLININKLYT
jgi:hypothetical protein